MHPVGVGVARKASSRTVAGSLGASRCQGRHGFDQPVTKLHLGDGEAAATVIVRSARGVRRPSDVAKRSRVLRAKHSAR